MQHADTSDDGVFLACRVCIAELRMTLVVPCWRRAHEPVAAGVGSWTAALRAMQRSRREATAACIPPVMLLGRMCQSSIVEVDSGEGQT